MEALQEKLFIEELQQLINKYSVENDSHTPDFVLATFIACILRDYSEAVKRRDKYFGVDMWNKATELEPPSNQ